uniref:hypothetical protein n=1 Tax=Paractinoplanes polyasparticus TaxID=2856853 RepID=UPI001C863D8A|nr:hypothetical protein [Actinoplanes polyasparticus]
MLLVVGQPLLSNDSYQYFSVASNILGGHGVTTDIPFFESELRHGVIPAPVTTAPPGYPIAVAALQALALGPRSAAVVVSIVSGALTVATLGLICRRLQMDSVVARYVLFAFAANASTLTYSISALSESLFTLLVTVAVLAVLISRRVAGDRTAYAIAALGGTAAGVATWVRYAGLFVLAGIVLALLIVLATARTRRAVNSLLAVVLPAGLIIAPLIARNVLLAGTWQGGNTVAGADGAARTLLKTAAGLVRLAGGDGTSTVAVVAQVTVAVFAVAVLAKLRNWPRDPDLNVAATVIAVYIAAIVVAALRSPIDIGARLLFPVLPLIALTGGMLMGRMPKRRPRPAWAALGVCAYLVAGCTTIDLPYRPPHDGVDQKLAAPLADGSRVRDWLAARIGPEAPVMAADSQATSYALHRPVVGMSESRYSAFRWDEATIANVMRKYRCRYLILYPDLDEGSGKTVQSESPFIESLLAGRSVAGFPVATRSREVIVFERRGS